MASRNGLNPKIRGPKGVGFGRALPAAFGFGNGFHSDGVSTYFTVPKIAGQSLTTNITFEFWADFINPPGNNKSLFALTNQSGSDSRIRLAKDLFYIGDNSFNNSLPTSGKHHIVFCIDIATSTWYFIIDNNPAGFTSGIGDNMDSYLTYLGASLTIAANEYQTEVTDNVFDEFRIYNKILSITEIAANYNNGIGNNPATTESLILWYKFEGFETLDFSLAQDGSNMALGIKDQSGKNNHAFPMNINTDIASPTYPLKPF